MQVVGYYTGTVHAHHEMALGGSLGRSRSQLRLVYRGCRILQQPVNQSCGDVEMWAITGIPEYR